jgi:phosphatidylglycerophosphate synthase
MLKYKEIKEATPYGPFRSRTIAEFICMNVSPFFSKFFIEWNFIPNFVTLLMIIFGVLGGIFFCFPQVWMKIIGMIFFYLWFIMDCSDGEVARVTKHFSVYGKEMDYMAHLICHPIMNFSFWLTYVSMGKYNLLYISVIFIWFISFELVSRSLIEFEDYHARKSEEAKMKIQLPSWPKYCFLQIISYPNIVLIFPIIILLDYIFDINTFYILIVVFLTHMIGVINEYVKRLISYYKS